MSKAPTAIKALVSISGPFPPFTPAGSTLAVNYVFAILNDKGVGLNRVDEWSGSPICSGQINPTFADSVATIRQMVADDIRAEHPELGSFEVHFLDTGEVA